MTNDPVLISGFHRSGTSAVARVLAQAGLDFGTNLLGASPDNPYGHFEDLDVIDAHDSALAANDLTWKSTEPCRTPRPQLASFVEGFAPSGVNLDTPWAVKDPRLCLFLDDWLAHFPNARLIHVLRIPGRAIASLHRRHARRYVDTRQVDPSDSTFWETPDLGLKLWAHYTDTVVRTLEAVAPTQVLIVDFDDRESLQSLPERCNAAWGLDLDCTPTTALDPELGHGGSSAPVEIRDPELVVRAAQLRQTVQILRNP